MNLMRWAVSAGLLLSAGMLANCSQIFEGEAAGGVTTAMLVGADGDAANWISHGRTYSEQRFSPLDGVNRENVGDLGLAWFADMDTARGQEATPLVMDGKLYLTTAWSKVKAFDATTGAKLWENGGGDMTKDQAPSAFGGGASYEAGRLYATNGVGEVKALNADTGEVLWKVKPAGPLRGSPTIAFGQLFVMTQDNQLISLKTEDGSLVWDESGSNTQSGVFGVAAPAAGQGTVIAGYSSGELSAYRYENGRTLWSDALARTNISTTVGSITDIDADPIIDSGRVYALGQGGRMAAYELVTGQRIWELNLAGVSTPAIAGEWIFTLTDDARLLAIARGSGRVRWISDLGQWRNAEKKKDPIFWTGPILAGNKLWVANSEGQIHRVSVEDGTATLFQTLKDPISQPPIVANNTLYVLDEGGTIHAFR